MNQPNTTCDLLQFEQAIGKSVKVTGMELGDEYLIDTITGVDYEYGIVHGKKWGDFPVANCELLN